MKFDKTFLGQIKSDLETGIVPVIITPPNDNVDALTHELRKQADTSVFVVGCAKLRDKDQLTNPAKLTDFGPNADRRAIYPNPAYLPAVTIKAAIEYANEHRNNTHVLALTGLDRNNSEIADTAINIALKRKFDNIGIPGNLKIILARHGALINFSALSADELDRTIIYKF